MSVRHEVSIPSSVRTTIDKEVATITIDRPDRLNALDPHALRLLNETLETLARQEAIKVVILTGAGSRAFSSGDDIKELTKLSREELVAHIDLGQRVTGAMVDHPYLLIAAIEGYCLGGGLEIALACDMRIASSEAIFGLPEVVYLNAVPSWGGTFRLPRLVGMARAQEMLLFGRRIDGATAWDWGLIAEIAAKGSVLSRAREIASNIPQSTQRSALSLAKRVVNSGFEMHPHAARHLEYLAAQTHLIAPAFALRPGEAKSE
ncbi:MAG: enoyl-CoA hydratase/isomerase family protein [Pseudorhodoplanes sp.]